jgi:hypothetical protein
VNRPVPIDTISAEILLNIFHQCLNNKGLIDAVSYRAEHEDWIEKLNELEQRQLLKREDNSYRITFIVLTLLEDNDILIERNRCESVFNILRSHYKNSATRNEGKLLKELSKDLGFSHDQMVQTILYFRDASSLWLGGSTSNFNDPESAYVKPSEAIITCKSFNDLIEKVQNWFQPNPIQLIPLVELLAPLSSGHDNASLKQTGSEPLSPRQRTHDVCELPDRVLQTYSRLWQLETWLRLMVYVELRAFMGDAWTTKIKLGKTEGSQKADKALIHMPTPQEDPLSYAQLSELRRIITENRLLFDCFLPPEKIWDARMDEIAQVRHRVAHFRKENERDLDRVAHLLRDIDKGFWKFCTSYNDRHPVIPQTDDPVVAHFLPFDLLPWVEIENGKWAQVGSVTHDQWFGVTVVTTAQPWAKWATPVAGREGILYDVTIFLRGSQHRHFDYARFLENTRSLHKHFVHICLSNHADNIRMTIPAILGEKPTIGILEQMIDMARSCAYSGVWPRYKGTIKSVADIWPEYVLEPEHALTLLTTDMPCSIFRA